MVQQSPLSPAAPIVDPNTGTLTPHAQKFFQVIWQRTSGQNGNGGIFPTGGILTHQGSLPSGYLACDGSAVSRTTYANLFSVIGTIYGPGDGSTTFNLPTVANGIIQT